MFCGLLVNGFLQRSSALRGCGLNKPILLGYYGTLLICQNFKLNTNPAILQNACWRKPYLFPLRFSVYYFFYRLLFFLPYVSVKLPCVTIWLPCIKVNLPCIKVNLPCIKVKLLSFTIEFPLVIF